MFSQQRISMIQQKSIEILANLVREGRLTREELFDRIDRALSSSPSARREGASAVALAERDSGSSDAA